MIRVLQRSIRCATRLRRRLKPFSRPNSCRSWPTCSRKPGSNNRTTRARPRTIRKNHSSKIESFPEWGGSGIAATLISFYAAAFSPPLSKTALTTFSAKRSRCSGFCLNYTAWQAIAPSRRASKTHPGGMFMTGKNTAAFGIYHSRKDAEFAVDTLRAEGFRNTDISVLFAENEGTKDFATEKHTRIGTERTSRCPGRARTELVYLNSTVRNCTSCVLRFFRVCAMCSEYHAASPALRCSSRLRASEAESSRAVCARETRTWQRS